MLSLRRRHSRWRMFLILLFLGMICSGELTPIHVLDESPSLSSSTSPTTKKKDIGSLSDWQAWLLTDAQSFQSGSDTYPGDLRRIMPKSIFIAPGLCPEGYDADQMGRCVKSISLNATAHNGFLLERLKFRYSNSQASKNDEKKSSGPLQLNIPLVLDINRQTNSEVDETFSKNRNETYFTRGEEKTRPRETFFLENSNLDDVRKSDRKPQTTVSIAETNDTNFSEIVDYKIPIDLKTVLNSSSVKKVDVSDGTEESVSIAEKREEDYSTETSPALVLLISPTKLTNAVDDLLSAQNHTEQIAQMSTVIAVRALDPTTLPPPAKQLTPSDEQRDNETYAEDELMTPETAEPNESQETDFYDAEEDDEDDSTEGEEILRHGEAGMTIPTRDVDERLDRDRDRHQRQRNQTADSQKKMLDIDDRVMIRFNDSAPTQDKEEAGSSISSEVSIDGDFILETTLLDVNTERLHVTTQSPDVTEKIIEDRENDSEEFDKRPDVAPEVVFSQDAHGRRRTEQLSAKLENGRSGELEAAPPSSSESLLYDSAVTEIRASEKQLNTTGYDDSKTLRESSKDTQSYFPASSSQRATMNLDSAEDFVRFPDYVRRPQQSNYVRFPSNEANSIHSLSYKQNSRYPADDVGPYGGTSTKSSVPIRQKPVYYLPSSWKLDRSQPDHIQTTANDERDRNRRPELMSIWSKMPLIRDPGLPIPSVRTTTRSNPMTVFSGRDDVALSRKRRQGEWGASAKAKNA